MKINIVSENESDEFCNFENLKPNVKRIIIQNERNVIVKTPLWNTENKKQNRKIDFAAKSKEAVLFRTEYSQECFVRYLYRMVIS